MLMDDIIQDEEMSDVPQNVLSVNINDLNNNQDENFDFSMNDDYGENIPSENNENININYIQNNIQTNNNNINQNNNQNNPNL